MPSDSSREIPRREFVKSAVAIGGASALSACLQWEGTAEASEPEFPQGPDDLAALPERQHAWGNYIVRDAHGNTVLPQHQVLLFLDYKRTGTPTAGDRETVEAALSTLDRAFQRGTGGDISASINEGLITMISYSRSYFDRFDADLPGDIDLQRPEGVLDAVGEDREKADHYDALLLLTADFGSILLSAEEALFGELDTVNGVDVEASLDGVFEKADRRTGVVGKGLPAEKLDEDRIPEHAPLSMGYKSGFRDSLPSEDAVTITGGPFDQATTQAASRLRIDLGDWYDHDDETRDDLMFSTQHDHEDIGETAEPLGGDSGVTEEMTENIEAHGEAHDRMGHTAKTATARNEDFEPIILRRSEGVATDVPEEGVTGFNFTAVQEGIEDFVETRKAMNPEEYDAGVEDPHHGIIDYLETRSRATFLVPPRSLRALPSPRPEGG
ncbi:MAG: hypothetical protein ABEH66_04405 [Halobacteriales archaeon]